MFFLPGSIFMIIILLAVFPALFLMRYVYRLDRCEKEPPRLLGRLIIMGVIAGFASMLLETVGQKLLSLTTLEPDSPRYIIVMCFLVVALVEEGTKYFFMHRTVWKNGAFNYRFDAIVYAVFTSLGFAAMENMMYVMGYGLSVVLSRALLAIPAHMSFSVVFGVFYGRAKMHANRGESGMAVLNALLGFFIAVFFHGFYDSCAMIGTGLSMALFALFIIVIYVTILMVVKSESRTDRPI